MARDIKSGSPISRASGKSQPAPGHSARSSSRSRFERSRSRGGSIGRQMPWYLRKRVMFPLALLISAIFVAGFCWWHIPVTNQITGERENMGTLMIRAGHALVRPQISLNTAFAGKRQVSVLLVGLDHVPATPGDPGILRRSDSVMVATTDFDTKQIRVVSIPRDGWLEHWQNGHNYGYERLGNTYSLGQERDLSNPLAGISRTRASVEHLLNLPVDFYVVIEFEGLVKLVDRLGGLVVDVEMDMHRDDNAGNLHIHLNKGTQLLTGEQVVHYARYRDQKLADLGRMPRQQKVVQLLLQEMMKAENLTKLPDLAEILHEAVITNLSLDQLIALAQHMDDYAPDCIKTKTMTSYYDSDPTMPEIQCPGVPEGTKIGAQCIYPQDARAARSFLLELAPPMPPEPAPAAAGDTANTGVSTE
jgi:LCP family protein required for cell wall assembly